ncbi:DNA-binding transcriptional LysR family regulator [Endozoicomonas sp. NE40]|uniref:DNA-binding transcriptional LysR family regulator n=1 Tax=Endozoicomonas lisbonensis TaxID=3120522 RepID=A0ABV2SFS5_9GAMM
MIKKYTNLKVTQRIINNKGEAQLSPVILPSLIPLHGWSGSLSPLWSELTLEDLYGEKLVCTYLKQTLPGRNIASIYQQQGMQPEPTVEVASSFHACSIVASGFGFTIADPLAAHDMGNDVVQVPVKTEFRYDFAFFEPVQTRNDPMVVQFKQRVKEVTAEYRQRCGFNLQPLASSKSNSLPADQDDS